VKHLQFIATWRDIRNADVSTRIGDCVIRRRQGDDYGTHLRMNVAEDKRDARLVELDKTRGSAFIEPEVEALALEERKHVVKERIMIGEIYDRTDLHDEYMRFKCFVALRKNPADWRIDGVSMARGFSLHCLV